MVGGKNIKKRDGKEEKKTADRTEEVVLFMSCSTGGKAIKDSRANGREELVL